MFILWVLVRSIYHTERVHINDYSGTSCKFCALLCRYNFCITGVYISGSKPRQAWANAQACLGKSQLCWLLRAETQLWHSKSAAHVACLVNLAALKLPLGVYTLLFIQWNIFRKWCNVVYKPWGVEITHNIIMMVHCMKSWTRLMGTSSSTRDWSPQIRNSKSSVAGSGSSL